MTPSPIRPVCLVLLAASTAAAVEPGLPSKTALAVVVQRATGSKDPNPRLRNPDYLADKFVGPREREAFKAALLLLPDAPKDALDLEWDAMVRRVSTDGGLYFHTARTKYFDETLLEAVRDKARQVVVLGAGFDSRAYRFQQELGDTRFFEVDYGPTQEYKKERLKEIFGSVPKHVHFIPMDFTKDDLLTELRKGGYSEKEKTFFLWEGVVAYLPESAVKETLRFVRDHSPAGSRLAFNYPLSRDPALTSPRSRFTIWGEPRIFVLPQSGIVEFLRQEGLETVSDVSLKELMKKYELPEQTERGRICVARVR